MRDVFDGVRYIARTGVSWRMMPHDLPPWAVVYRQHQRWLKAGVSEQMAHDLRLLLRELAGRKPTPTAALLDSRTLQSTPESPESGGRAGYDGAKRKKGNKVHLAVDTLGHLLAAQVTPADQQDRTQVGELCRQVQAVTGESVQIAYVDQGYTGDTPQAAAQPHNIELVVVKLPASRKGFVLLPRRWVVERSFAWATRFRRLAKDYERLAETLAGLHFLAFVILLLQRYAALLSQSS